jgi:hypothetical protein
MEEPLTVPILSIVSACGESTLNEPNEPVEIDEPLTVPILSIVNVCGEEILNEPNEPVETEEPLKSFAIILALELIFPLAVTCPVIFTSSVISTVPPAESNVKLPLEVSIS